MIALLVEFRHGRHLAQPALTRLVVEMDWLDHTLVVRHIFQRGRVDDCGFLALKAFCSDIRLAVYDLGLRAPLGLDLVCLWRVFLHNLPPSVLACARWQFIRGDFDEALAVWIRDEVAWWEYFGVHDRLQTMMVCIIVDLAVDFVLNDFVFVGFDDFMYNGWKGSDLVQFTPLQAITAGGYVRAASLVSLSTSTVFRKSTTPSRRAACCTFQSGTLFSLVS